MVAAVSSSVSGPPRMTASLNPRQLALVQQAREDGFVMIEEAATRLGVTTQTIRRDLALLCDGGVLTRFHGGAAFRSSTANLPYEARRGSFQHEKELIAAMVAEEIEDGSSVFLDIGTTAEAVALRLRDKRALRIVTNNINVVTLLAERESFAITIVGGSVRNRDLAVNGDAAAGFIERFRLDYSVLGVVAITETGEILDFSLDEHRLTQAVLGCGRRAFVVADRSKFGRPAMASVGHLSQADTLFTDALPPGPWAGLAEIVRLRTAEGAGAR